MKDEIYISFDIEADGPVPGLYSMLSIGMCVAGYTVKGSYVEANPEVQTIYIELQPISDIFVKEAIAVNKLDRDYLSVHGKKPCDAVNQLAEWITTYSTGFNPVLVAYPATFDWPFLSYYFNRFFKGDPPVNFTRVCDIRTMLVTKSQSLFYTPTDKCLPQEVLVKKEYSHNGLIDAIEQARLFSSVYLWDVNKTHTFG